MKNILIVDHTDQAGEIAAHLSTYQVDICSTAFDAISKLNIKAYDLVISEVELPGDNSFEFYYYIKKNLPYMPVIMVTNNNIDNYFEDILTNGIGNVLPKPIEKEELLALVSKLVLESPLFGLKNYLSPIIEQKKITINKSNQIMPAIEKATDILENWGFCISNKMMINLILNELIINAVYHAHGFTQQKLDRIKIALPEDKHVDLCFAYNVNEYAISITDYMGTLTSKRILESIYNVIIQRKILDEAAESGDMSNICISESGRGLEIVRRLAKEYYFIIHKDRRTEAIIKFHKEHTFDSECSSIKIIERY